MKVLLDTSVLVAALVGSHPAHDRALPWLVRAKEGRIDLVVASHSIAELYAVLTTLPLSPRITPGVARRLMQEDIESTATLIALSNAEYLAVVKRMSELGIPGGATYDALIVKAAQKAEVKQIVTLNSGDFKRVWPEGKEHIAAP
jgi:predicted nucleic acid-binding protein